ncbi:hypothetical protein H4Q32_029326 [Labeo rohita]|uniref:Uncharacterized protein n=1 Tax=Labeo rohita TaxID=84645 RepID=A0ABQ8MVX3_LABRO|nr:hypothetical protein H4Q32_029326 [Labeo rohita]
MPTCLGHVEETLVLVSGPGAGSSLSPHNASDKRVPHRLGSGHEWPPRPRSVEWSPSSLALQLPGDAGRVSGPLRAGPSGEGHGPPHSSVPVSNQCPWEISLPTLSVLQGAAVSSEPTPQSSARRRSGARELATPAGVSTAASSAVSCRSSVTGHRTSSVETTAKCVCMGPAHCEARLSHPIRRSAAAFQLSRAGSGNGTGSRNSEEGGHRGGPSSRQGVQVLQPVLHCSEEGWGPASLFRSETTESFSYEVEVQNTDYQSSGVTNQVRGLVCDDRSKRRLLPCLHPSSTQKVPEVCFQGEAYQYRVLPFGLALSPRTFTKCSDSAASAHSITSTAGLETERQEECAVYTSSRLRDYGECAMSPLVLSDLSSSTGAGCHGTDVAEASSVRFSPDHSAPGSSGEIAPGRGPSSFSSPVLKGNLPMGDSRQEGSPLSGGRHHPPPSPGVVEVMGVAPEGAHLVASGLSTEVVETILQSRAPSTRKLYTLKWTLFTSW